MSVRSFRDRYGALERSVDTSSERDAPAREWPIPAGGALLTTSFGETVVCDAAFGGADIDIARTWLTTAGIAPDIDSTLFIDTETTGLAGGTGTHVFLVGLGRFVGGGFQVRQFFMRHPGEERALLAAIEHELRDSSCVVTYNGRTFDIPMLQTRFRMHHQECAFPEQHLDLLHPVRSLWKHRLPGCSLGTVERDILGVTRADDAPGWMIPQLYFTYLQNRRVEALHDVFNHNRQDIISLARIAGLVHAYQSGIEQPDHPVDRLSLAILQLRLGDLERALPVILAESGSALIPAELRVRATRDVSSALKRARRYAEAIEFWERCLGDPSRAVRAFAAEELAKQLEHRTRDHERALDLARRAAEGARIVGDSESFAAFEKRVLRLEEKIRRKHASTSSKNEQENV